MSNIRGFLLFSGTTLALLGCATGSQKSLSSEERAHLLVEAANGAISEGDPTGALQLLAQAEAIEPKMGDIHLSKAIAYYNKHDLQTAITEARSASELDPKNSETKNTLGKLLLDAGKYHEAESPLLAAAHDALYRDNFKPYTNLGIMAYRQGNFSQANQYFDRAVESAPAGACVAYYYKGHIELKNGHMDDAIRQYERASQKFCSNFSDAHLALGIAYERSRNFEKARKKFLAINQSFPNSKAAEAAMDRLKFLP